ncbi:MAG TPA: translation initiation factor IF-2 [Candidatus Nanoarchaeia archaeon]|nr:translation initiation factor IF-2 [Candidatus Nanoarchaeia archaeon]
MLRQVIVAILGNVDSGKSKLVETIKKISILASEPGKITQSIRAYSISMDAIKDICKELLDIKKMKVPGVLLIDTPGHAAFSNLRKRGGSLADIAVLVVDINEGIKPQTIECVEILKANKTPFVVALNKADLINGWHSNPNLFLNKNIDLQSDSVKKSLDNKLYSLVARLHELGFASDRFDRIEDFTKNLAVIPTSAKTGEGIPELLMMIAGLAQRFLESELKYDENVPGEGTILEVSEEKGLGMCIDAIVYSGRIKINDNIVIGTLAEPLVTKVKALFIQDKSKLKNVKEVSAAVGVKIVLHNAENLIPGMPVKVANVNLEKIKSEIAEQIKEITLDLDHEGIILKADSLGSLEALINLLKEKKIKIKTASTGEISKKDIAEAEANSDILNKVVLGFNVKNISSEKVNVLTNDVIYTLVENFEKWRSSTKSDIESKKLSNLVKPCKIKVLEGYVFRKSNPAVVGVDILAGTLKAGTPLMKENYIDDAKSIQHEGKTISEAKKGQSIALAMQNITIGRQVKEGDILYSDIPEEQFRAYKKLKDALKSEEKELLKEIAEVKRKKNPNWGI